MKCFDFVSVRASLISAMAVVGVSMSSDALAQYQQLVPFEESNPGAGAGNLSGVAIIGGEYVFTNSFSNPNTNKVVAGPAFDTIVDNDDILFAGGDVRGLTPGQFYANSATTGLFGDQLSDSLFLLDVAGETLTQVASSAQIAAFAGGTTSGGAPSANVVEQVIDANGNLIFNESISDSLVRSTSSGTLSTLASSQDLIDNIGNNTINGLTASPSSDLLFFGDDGTDVIYSLDYSGSTNVYNTILTNAEIASVTGDTTLQVDQMLFAPDGYIYFYDGRTDSIYSFDPDDAANSLDLVIDEDSLNDGPAGSDLISGLTWSDAGIAWWYTNRQDATITGLYAIPEPATMMLLGAGGLLIVARRRRQA